MRTYEKIALQKEQQLLSTLQPKQKLQAKKKIIWTINTSDVRYEMIAIGRIPNGIEVRVPNRVWCWILSYFITAFEIE